MNPFGFSAHVELRPLVLILTSVTAGFGMRLFFVLGVEVQMLNVLLTDTRNLIYFWQDKHNDRCQISCLINTHVSSPFILFILISFIFFIINALKSDLL